MLRLPAIAAGDLTGFGVDQVNARASGAGHHLIGRGIIVRRGVGGIALNVEAGDWAAIDESGHRNSL